MRVSILLLLIFLSFTICFAVTPDTFGQVYGPHRNIYSVQQTFDGGFVLGTDRGIIKTDATGRIQWQEFIENNGGQIQVLQNSAAFIFAAYVQRSGSQRVLILKKFTSQGEYLDETILMSGETIFIYNILPTPDNGITVLLRNTDLAPYLLVCKYNAQFVSEWQKEIITQNSFRALPHLTRTADSGFLAIGARGKLTRFNSAGDTLWTNYSLSNDYHLVAEMPGGNVVVSGFGRAGILDSDGNLLKESLLAMDNARGMAVDSKTGSIFLAGDSRISLYSMDADLNMLWSDSTENDAHKFENIIVTDDAHIIATGENILSYRAFLLKTDSEGNYDYLSLVNPEDGQILRISDKLSINWATTLAGNMNLDYSVDNGSSWMDIVSNYSANKYEFEWVTPGLSGNQFLIRIESSEDPQRFDQNDLPLTLIRKDYDYIATNEVLMWFGNNGDGSHDPITDGNGFYWPGGVNATQSASFEDGLLWGGYVGDSIRVNGNTHRQGLQPGNILENGMAADPQDPKFGIWRARKNWQSLPEGNEKDRLQYDWNNWPVDLGAPWLDNDLDGFYDPQIDQPHISGDETFWMVMNDIDTTVASFTYGADPIGLEIRLQVYAYDQDNDLADVVFKKYQVYNKGQNNLDSMFFAYWSDPDLGNAGDDYVGCDTMLNLAYCYNDDDDDSRYEAPVPAIGYLLLQGPKIDAQPSDQALFFGDWIAGYDNAEWNAFTLFIGGSSFYQDPRQGDILGSYEFYNYFNGYRWDGEPLIDPLTAEPAKFVLAGDPVNNTGWYEGSGWPSGPASGDRRMVFSTGPFDFVAGDSQEVVFALIMARGENYLDSVTELKRKAQAVKEFYYTGILPLAIDNNTTEVTPQRFELKQNYPNPFNNVTMINYQLPMSSDVKLVIYDVLGREVKILVNKKQSTGNYQVSFDASGLASGIYYYKLLAGDINLTRKMLLLK